jgi:glycosyltransferase involved in cell wall biosynthesis
MNLLFISNDPLLFVETSAVRARMLVYAKVLQEKKGRLYILSRAPITQEIQEENLFLYGVKCSKAFGLFTLFMTARRIIKEKDIAIVSAQDPFEYGLIARCAQLRTTAKLHIQIHTDLLSPWFSSLSPYTYSAIRAGLLNRIRIPIANHVISHANRIRVVSKRIQDSIIRTHKIKPKYITILPIKVEDANHERVELPNNSFTTILISVGRLETEKRVGDTICAFAKIHKRYPGLGLYIIGEGRERSRLECLVKNLELSEKVIFLGRRTDVLGLMQSAQGFIQSSIYEGYGITLIEAALAKLPVMTSDVGIVRDVLIHNESALVSPVGDIEKLSENLVFFMENQEKVLELGAIARSKVLEHTAHARNMPKDIIADILNTTDKSYKN